MSRYDLSGYDGVLAFGDVLRRALPRAPRGREARLDLARGRRRARLPPGRASEPDLRATTLQDLVWIGNWGDGERTDELARVPPPKPVADARARSTTVHGVRYPLTAQQRALCDAGIHYAGYLPNHRAPADLRRLTA